MTEIDALVKKALEYKEKGLTNSEISDELHVSVETVGWLLTRDIGVKAPMKDVKIGWRSIGVYGSRLRLLADILASVVIEETTNRNQKIDTIVGVAINGIPMAVLMSEKLGSELAIYRPVVTRTTGGAFSSNYASVDGKKVVIVDDVLSTGDTIKGAINEISENNGEPILITVVVNKTSNNDIAGIPLRAIIRARTI